MAAPIPRQVKDEYSDKLCREDLKSVSRHLKLAKEKEQKVRDLCKQEGGGEKLMDFIFGKTKENPLAENKKG